VEAETSQQVLAELLDTLKLRLISIHDTVRFRTAIPTTQVYVCYLYRLYRITMNFSLALVCSAGQGCTRFPKIYEPPETLGAGSTT